MTVRTRADLETALRTGGSSDNGVETEFLKDLLDSVPLDTEVTTDLSAYQLEAGPFVLPEFTVATMPVGQAEGTIVYVSDGASNKYIAIFDGTNWRYADGAVVGA